MLTLHVSSVIRRYFVVCFVLKLSPVLNRTFAFLTHLLLLLHKPVCQKVAEVRLLPSEDSFRKIGGAEWKWIHSCRASISVCLQHLVP